MITKFCNNINVLNLHKITWRKPAEMWNDLCKSLRNHLTTWSFDCAHLGLSQKQPIVPFCALLNGSNKSVCKLNFSRYFWLLFLRATSLKTIWGTGEGAEIWVHLPGIQISRVLLALFFVNEGKTKATAPHKLHYEPWWQHPRSVQFEYTWF